MFKRVILEDWANLMPMIAFFTLFAVFVATSLRAIRLKPDERKRMAELPLSDNEPSR